jgi:hypothetical protein
MKWKVGLMMLIIGFIAFGSLTIVGQAEATHFLDGNWTMNFEWKGIVANDGGNDAAEPLGTVTWTIQMFNEKFGQFQSSSGAYGYILYIPEKEVFMAIYSTGCKPIYLDKNVPYGSTSMSGIMFCTDGSVGWGTWNARKQ